VHQASLFSDLCEELDAARERLGVPGAAVGVLHQGEERTAGFGVTSVENPLAVTADTLFQIGSITKTVTGTTAMRLVEDAKLNLEWPVRAYLPDLGLADEDVAANVTMRHLFTHTGGWEGDFFDDLGAGGDALARMVAQLDVLPQLTPLGELWTYNNTGFYIAGRVIEVLAGKPFEETVAELVLEPLGLTSTLFFPADVMTHRFAVGHLEDGDETKVARPWDIGRAAYPAGGLSSTVRDLLRYARFHLGEAPHLLREETLALMQAPQVSAGPDRSVGLTWFVRELDGRKLITHGGGTNGQISLLMIVPDGGFALAILTNDGRGGELIDEVRRSALKRYLGLDDLDPEPGELPENALAEYVGTYTSALADLELVPRDGGLELRMTPKGGFPKRDSPPLPTPPPAQLGFYDTDQAVGMDARSKGARFEFLRGADGEIVWMRSGRLFAKG
jgi:CubicO group peptidase (beta-lactamase class C family)